MLGRILDNKAPYPVCGFSVLMILRFELGELLHIQKGRVDVTGAYIIARTFLYRYEYPALVRNSSFFYCAVDRIAKNVFA